MNTLDGEPQSAQISSALSSLESSEPGPPESHQRDGLGLGGKILRIALAVVIMLVCAFAPPLLMRIPVVYSFALAHENPDDVLELIVVGACVLLSYGVAVVLALVMCTILRRTLDRNRPVGLGLRFDRRALLWMVGMILAALVVDLSAGGIIHVLGVAGGGEPAAPGPLGLVIVSSLSIAFLLQGIPEEMIWRGWLFSSLGETRFAAVVSVVVFTVLHLVSQSGQQNLLEHITYLALPCGFAVTAMIVRIVFGSTWAAVGVHGGFHTVNYFVAGPLRLSASSVIWLLQGLLWAAVGVLILVVHRRRQRLAALTGRPC